MILPIEFIVPNNGPPVFSRIPQDVYLRVGEKIQLDFSSMKDPDFDDVPSMKSIEFGGALNFIHGVFPTYFIAPTNNLTNPGIYKVKIEI